MSNSTVNFTSPEASTNKFGSENSLDLYLYSINVLFGFPTHSYVLWLIITGTKSGVASEFFNLNLSVCEIGVCLNCLLFILSSCFALSHLGTSIWFLLGLIVTGRPLFQCLMCVERYLAVVHPVTFLKYKPLRYRVICCGVVWIIIIGSCLCGMFCFMLNYVFVYTWFFSPQFLILLSIQLFCLVAVLRTLKQSGPGERAREKEENHMKRRAFYLILITTLTMCVIYIPMIIYGISVIVTSKLIKGLFSFGFICYVFGGFVQPVVYLHRVGKLSCLCWP
ncbi:uracil nucleotide/cysteinyl leukotriene receptor-like [Danio aesculapii]|uniref:uracil nucleotide/cysteinyl leukotriene receptor-like n=1 Tax=Danio aesculapii TaxID=1142201 RepID=UPI0024C075A4|nr:uracil nucleotide/cysteinyl leukotriene receptor-like [Danio aesculapii]